MRPQTHYKKPKKAKSTVIATLRIVLTAFTASVFGIVFYFAGTQGWESVFAWFGGKYFCMIVMILLFAITAAAWLWMVVKNIRRITENE